MAKDSNIEWCDHTFNPWIGCAKVSPGCANCYAETQNNLRKWNPAGWGKGVPRSRTSDANWKLPLKWNRDSEYEFSTAFPPKRRPRVFCASLADWLDDEVPIEWLADLMELIRRTPYLDWLLLTKRPENFATRLYGENEEGGAFEYFRTIGYSSFPGTRGHEMMDWIGEWANGQPPSNVWIGTTVENQAMADARIPHLLSIPARVRFLSCEPLLGPVDIFRTFGRLSSSQIPDGSNRGWLGLHWVICGGESGAKARPMHPDWARSLRDFCQSAGIPFLFKQWGEWSPGASMGYYPESKPLTCLKPTGEQSWCAGDLESLSNWSQNYESTDCPMNRVGKKAAGRMLDGREWNEFPKS